MKVRYFLALAAVAALLSGCSGEGKYPDGNSRYEAFAPDDIPFVVTDTPWTIDQRGNHRAVVAVKEDAAGVAVNLPWRRPDLNPESKRIVVTDADGNEVKDVMVTSLTSEDGSIIFRPASGPGTYYVYYLPFKWQTWYHNVSDYLPPEYEADPAWKSTMTSGEVVVPVAEVERFESVARFHFWSPMGLIARASEIEEVKAAVGEDMVVFPEDRAFPIQFKALPAKWTSAPSSKFSGLAMRNEYYTWQLGIWAAGKDLKDVKVEFDGLRKGGSVIPAEEMTCFNQEGTSWDGSHLEFKIDVRKGDVQALWCGVQIPEDAKPGIYRGEAVVSAEGVEPQTVELAIKVSSKVLADSGDSEVWRHSRLRWINSRIMLDDLEPTASYKEMNLDGRDIEATGKTVKVGGNGMVSAASVNGIDILAKPQRLVVSTSKGDVEFSSDNVSMEKKGAGLVAWKASSEQDGLKFGLEAEMEFDGHLHFDLNVSSDEEVQVKDVKFETVFSDYSSEYFMGTGFDGGYRPASYSWDWTGPYDSYWMGGVKAGMQTEFRGADYHGPLLWAFKTAPSPVWSNDGKGRVFVKGAKGKSASVVASTGPFVLGKDPRNFEFSLTLTPAKDLDPKKHFSERYFHADPLDFDKAAQDGANIANIHHAQRYNPYINYPFIVRDSLIGFINHEHENGRKVKLYYTMRELSCHCEEIYAFNSLNNEILAKGNGGGNAWLCEHMVEGYWPAWYTSLDAFWKGDSDPSLQMVGNSRYINYFLEGVKWMEQNYNLDGLYMDDLCCDRITIKRLRKILDSYHEGALIDLHSNTWYSKGPANQYTEFFPFLDRLWFGESFQYDKMSPDEWLVTFSGIPFGVMSEMLQDGGNRFLGMVYGTTARHSWSDTQGKKSPVPMWKFWESYKIQDTRMVGYWDPSYPVKTSDPEVKATAYLKDKEVLVSIGNFSKADKAVSLSIDWKALGIDPATAVITAPKIENFQEETTFKAGNRIPVKSKEGWLLIIK